MDSVYSQFLLISLVSGGLGFAILILVAVLPNHATKYGPKIALSAFICYAIAFLFGLISFSLHLVNGHGPESVAPMATWEFILHHRAYWFVLIFTVLGYSVWVLVGRQRG